MPRQANLGRAVNSSGLVPRPRLQLAWVVALVLVVVCGCASRGPYVWVHDVQAPKAVTNRLVIVPGDTVSVSVYSDEKLSGQARVRSDGYITLQLVGDVLAAGKTPSALAQELTTMLSKYINAPTVAVSVMEEVTIRVTVVGEVETVGVVNIPRGSGVLVALATAGGLTEYANWDAIFVMRRVPRVKVRFSFDDLVANDAMSTDFPLLDGDTIYVE